MSQAIVFAFCAVAILAIYLVLRERQNPRARVQWGWLLVILVFALLALLAGLVL